LLGLGSPSQIEEEVMKRTAVCLAVAVVANLLTLGLLAQQVPGTVLRQFQLPLKTPTGLTWDGSHLWVADLDSAKLYRLNPSDGKVVDSVDAPGYSPMGLAWDGSKLWCLDLADKTAYALNPTTRVTLRALPLDTDTAEGIAWDGGALWTVDARAGVINRLDEEDGTTFKSFTCPTGGGSRRTDEIGMAFDSVHLWVSDRITDTIYQVDPASGAVLADFPSPGPYPTGLAWDGHHLWCADYESRTLYELQVASSAPYVTRDPKREELVYTEAWRNFGPGVVKSLEVYIAVPQDLPNQKLLEPPRFEPSPADFVTDQWGQKCAHFVFQDVKPGQEVTAVMRVKAELYRVRWFVDPEKVGKLEEIPEAIRKAYTQDSSKLVMTDPVIERAVKEALGGERNPYWMARKINQYIQGHLHYELAGGWNVAPTVLARGSGSCSEYTFVMLAMCHAAGLPARYAGSVVIRGDDASRDDVFHRWVEVYLPHYGWFPVDPSGGDSPVPAEQADYFGGLANRFLITTLGAGDSKTLGWDYDSSASWTGVGRVKLMQRKAGEWSPLGKRFEPALVGKPGELKSNLNG
jgi:transglutaminase-like putative cysteine protease